MSLKYLDENGLIYYHSLVKNLLGNKVDKALKTGSETAYKVLSDNNYTDAEKNKLSNIAPGAQVNKIEAVQVNGIDLTITNKKVNITVPTKVSQLINDSFVSYSTQELTDSQKQIARSNIGAGTSSFSGKYNDLTGRPTIPTKLTDLTNDGNFVSDANYIHTDNNFTTALKDKLSGIAANAQVNTIETIKVNGTALTPTNKAVNITVPTKVSQLTNDSKYQTDAQVTTAINNALAGITGIEFKIVESLPATGNKGTIYLKAHTHGTQDNYDEYVYVNNKWEKIGNTDIDLSNYVTFDDLIAITNTEIDAIIAA